MSLIRKSSSMLTFDSSLVYETGRILSDTWERIYYGKNFICIMLIHGRWGEDGGYLPPKNWNWTPHLSFWAIDLEIRIRSAKILCKNWRKSCENWRFSSRKSNEKGHRCSKIRNFSYDFFVFFAIIKYQKTKKQEI